MNASRRAMLAFLGGGAATALVIARGNAARPAKAYPVQFDEAEWRRRLTPEQFRILRQAGTEWPGTSPLLREHRRGVFCCAADGNRLFSSSTKFESGTGWPSFWRPLPGGIETASDSTLGEIRTEVRCTRCGGHLGHVFNDGPPPTGLRYCMNGAALRFVPA